MRSGGSWVSPSFRRSVLDASAAAHRRSDGDGHRQSHRKVLGFAPDWHGKPWRGRYGPRSLSAIWHSFVGSNPPLARRGARRILRELSWQRDPRQKGTSVLPVVAALKALPDRTEVVPQHLWKYFDDHLLVSAWYPERDYFALLEALVKTIDPKTVGGDVWRYFARFSVQRDIAGTSLPGSISTEAKGVYRNFATVDGGDPEQFFRHAVKLWSQYHDTGTMQISGGRVKTNTVVHQLLGFRIPTEGFVRLQGYYLEDYGRLVGLELESKVTRSTARGGSSCEWELRARTHAGVRVVRGVAPGDSVAPRGSLGGRPGPRKLTRAASCKRKGAPARCPSSPAPHAEPGSNDIHERFQRRARSGSRARRARRVGAGLRCRRGALRGVRGDAALARASHGSEAGRRGRHGRARRGAALSAASPASSFSSSSPRAAGHRAPARRPDPLPRLSLGRLLRHPGRARAGLASGQPSRRAKALEAQAARYADAARRRPEAPARLRAHRRRGAGLPGARRQVPPARRRRRRRAVPARGAAVQGAAPAQHPAGAVGLPDRSEGVRELPARARRRRRARSRSGR